MWQIVAYLQALVNAPVPDVIILSNIVIYFCKAAFLFYEKFYYCQQFYTIFYCTKVPNSGPHISAAFTVGLNCCEAQEKASIG